MKTTVGSGVKPVEGGHRSLICREWVCLYLYWGIVGLPLGIDWQQLYWILISSQERCVFWGGGMLMFWARASPFVRLASGQYCCQCCSFPHMEEKIGSLRAVLWRQTSAGWAIAALLYLWQLWIDNLWLGVEVYNQKGGEQAWICGGGFWLRGWYRKMRDWFTRFP